MAEDVEEFDDDLTDNVLAETFTPAGAHLELQILQQGQREFRFPFLQEEIVFAEHARSAFPQGSPWKARLASGRVTLHNSETGQSLPLTPGTIFDLEDSKIALIDARQAPLGRLEGISEPFTGRVWTIDLQQTWLGRQGRRFNHIEINHATISRTHATFMPDHHGRVVLVAESTGSAVSVNGEAMKTGETRRLSHGDLLTLGGLQFRFHAQGTAQTGKSLLNVLSLGTFQVALGAPAETGAQITTKKARWLLAALAASWGAARPVETLLEWLWPDLTVERARRNLSNVISRIREELNCEPADFETLLIRTPSTLGLNPERLGSHDFEEVRKLTRNRGALTSVAGLENLLTLYRGPYLPTCLEDWAEALRQGLELDVLETLLATARYFREQGNFEPVSRACEKCLQLDSLNEEAASLLMEAYLRVGRPERAIKFYESQVRVLQREGFEPSTDMIRLHLEASLALGVH